MMRDAPAIRAPWTTNCPTPATPEHGDDRTGFDLGRLESRSQRRSWRHSPTRANCSAGRSDVHGDHRHAIDHGLFGKGPETAHRPGAVSAGVVLPMGLQGDCNDLIADLRAAPHAMPTRPAGRLKGTDDPVSRMEVADPGADRQDRARLPRGPSMTGASPPMPCRANRLVRVAHPRCVDAQVDLG